MVDKKEELTAYVVDFGDPGYNDVCKCVAFTQGVGVLDHVGISAYRPDIYVPNEDGVLRPSGQYAAFTLEPFAAYFSEHGCKVTPVTDIEAERVRQALAKGQAVSAKYLKSPPVDKPGKAAASEKPDAPPVGADDIEPPKRPAKGKK